MCTFLSIFGCIHGFTDVYISIIFTPLEHHYTFTIITTNFSRHILAIFHFNENLLRTRKTDKNGNVIVNVSYPKYRMGEEIVREIAVAPTYGNLMIKPVGILGPYFLSPIFWRLLCLLS